jgi:dihydrodipicolinate reductase
MFITVPTRTSAAVEQMLANPLTGVVRCRFKDGYTYEYKNVSRRAITNLLLNPNMSLGFWVNKNLVQNARPSVDILSFSVVSAN